MPSFLIRFEPHKEAWDKLSKEMPPTTENGRALRLAQATLGQYGYIALVVKAASADQEILDRESNKPTYTPRRGDDVQS